MSCDLKECGQNQSYFTSLNSQNGKCICTYDVNIWLRCLGKGRAVDELFSAIMDMPPPMSDFQNFGRPNIVLEAVFEISEDSVKNIKWMVGDVAITVDSTWMCRGYVSQVWCSMNDFSWQQ